LEVFASQKLVKLVWSKISSEICTSEKNLSSNSNEFYQLLRSRNFQKVGKIEVMEYGLHQLTELSILF